MQNNNKARLLWIVLFTIHLLFFSAFDFKSNAQSESHYIDAGNVKGLHDLFRFKNDGIYFLSSHRGGPDSNFSENSIETFDNTLNYTYTIIECDPRYTKDSVIVLHHDRTLDRTTTGHGKVSDFTLKELENLHLKDIQGNVTSAKIPTLDEALQWARGKTILVLDKKDVPIEKRVEKITSHHAEAWAMVIAYNYEEAKRCFELNNKIMIEVFINSTEKIIEFEKFGVPWENVVVFVGHFAPEDPDLYQMIHDKGALCIQGTSRNLDRIYKTGEVSKIEDLENEYNELFRSGVDIIETDIPVPLSRILPEIPKTESLKTNFFKTN